MYDIKILRTGLVYVSDLKKIYAKIKYEVILHPYWEYLASPIIDDINIVPIAGKISKNIDFKVRVCGAISSNVEEGRKNYTVIEIHNDSDGVASDWDINAVQQFIGPNIYQVAAEVLKGGAVVSPGPGTGTITSNSDIDIE